MAENKNYTDKILKIQMRNLQTGQNNHVVTLTIKDLNKIIRDVFKASDVMQFLEVDKVTLLENCWNEKAKASRKVYGGV